MAEKRKCGDSSSEAKKKLRHYDKTYINFGFIEGQDKSRPECVFCGEKLANDSMKPSKMKRHQETKHPETIGKDKEFLERKKRDGSVKKIDRYQKSIRKSR